MKNRSLTSRNVFGGFLGGFLGIIAFSLFDLLLPVGCLLGVVIGFWYQEIWSHAVHGYKKSCQRVSAFYYKAIVAPKNEFREWIKKIKAKALSMPENEMGLEDMLFCIMRVLISMLWLGCEIIRAVWAAIRWPMRHPMNGVYLVTSVAALVFLAAISVPLYFKFCLWGYDAYDDLHGSPGQVKIIGSLFLLAGPALWGIMYAFQGSPDKNPSYVFYSDWERYSHYGLAGILGYKLLMIAKQFGLFLLLECLVVTYFALGIVSVLGLMVFPMLLTMWTLRALWHFATMKNHWLCFSVTLAVTITSALLMGRYLHGLSLWLVAMATGSLTGIISELVRRGLSLFLTAKPSLMAFANRKFGDDAIDSIIVPMWQKRYSWLRRYMFEWIPVHM